MRHCLSVRISCCAPLELAVFLKGVFWLQKKVCFQCGAIRMWNFQPQEVTLTCVLLSDEVIGFLIQLLVPTRRELRTNIGSGHRELDWCLGDWVWSHGDWVWSHPIKPWKRTGASTMETNFLNTVSHIPWKPYKVCHQPESIWWHITKEAY